MHNRLLDDIVPDLTDPAVASPRTPPRAEHARVHELFAPPQPLSAPPPSPTLVAAPPPSAAAPPYVVGPTYPPAGPPKGVRRRPWRYLLAALVLLLVVAGSIGGGVIGARLAPTATPTTSGHSVALSPSVADLQQAVENVSQGVQPSVVELTTESASRTGLGSGVILTPDGYIVTNDHVVKGFSAFTVALADGTALAATIVGEAAQDDLAVLKVSASNLTPMTFADASTVKVGQFTIAIGSPVDLQNTATFGIVSALNRVMSDLPDSPAVQLVGLVQTTADINPGNSGGALVDLQGRLIGVPTLKVTDTTEGTDIDGIGFAISADRVKYVAAQLIQHKRLVNSGQGFLGAQGEDVTAELAAANRLSVKSGFLVKGFTNATSNVSPAQQAGVRTGDVITKVNGQVIAGGDDLAGATLTRSPGVRVTLTLVRGSQQLTLQVSLGERPINP